MAAGFGYSGIGGTGIALCAIDEDSIRGGTVGGGIVVGRSIPASVWLEYDSARPLHGLEQLTLRTEPSPAARWVVMTSNKLGSVDTGHERGERLISSLPDLIYRRRLI